MTPDLVSPAQAGIPLFGAAAQKLDRRLRGDDERGVQR